MKKEEKKKEKEEKGTDGEGKIMEAVEDEKAKKKELTKEMRKC